MTESEAVSNGRRTESFCDEQRADSRTALAPSSNNTHASRTRWPVLGTVLDINGSQDSLAENSAADNAAKEVQPLRRGQGWNSATTQKTKHHKPLCCCLCRRRRPFNSTDGRQSLPRPGYLRLHPANKRRPYTDLPTTPGTQEDEHIYSHIQAPHSTRNDSVRFRITATSDGGYETVSIDTEVKKEPNGATHSTKSNKNWSRDNYDHLQWKEYQTTDETYSHFNWKPQLNEFSMSKKQSNEAEYSTLSRDRTNNPYEYDHLDPIEQSTKIQSISDSTLQDGIPFNSTVLISVCLFGQRGKETPV